MENRRKFRLADVILSVICVVFVAEAAAPVASIGNSQYFWWLFMIAAFLLPYGLIASELGTAFPGDGGLYDWIQTAYPGTRWGARASWYYWINFPLWMASLAVVCPELLEVIFGGRIGPVWSLVIQLAFIWIVTWIAAYPVCDSILILNLSAAIKILLALTVGVLGIVYVSKNGFVNNMEARTFLPSFDLNSLSYISVILFNFLGFEVVCTYADNMQAPRRPIPHRHRRHRHRRHLPVLRLRHRRRRAGTGHQSGFRSHRCRVPDDRRGRRYAGAGGGPLIFGDAFW